jgi:SAM-dependent methyltransferase
VIVADRSRSGERLGVLAAGWWAGASRSVDRAAHPRRSVCNDPAVSFDDGRATSFGELAEQYDRSRPSYPARLVDDLVGDAAASVVDVGCGTGIAARLFLARGCRVVGIEPDARMAEVARRRGVEVVVTRFEDWQPSERADLVISGQAWHWVDAVRGPAKAAEVLREGGRFAAFWNNYEHLPAADDCFASIYERLAPTLARASVALGRLRADDPTRDDPAAQALAATGAFTGIQRRNYHWSRVYSAEAWIAELGTHSDHRLLDDEQRLALFGEVRDAVEQLGGRLDVRFRTGLITALRASRRHV